MYRIAFKRLGLSPQECLIVEDAGPGIEAAKASGAHLCRVSGFTEVEYDRVKRFINKVERDGN